MLFLVRVSHEIGVMVKCFIGPSSSAILDSLKHWPGSNRNLNYLNGELIVSGDDNPASESLQWHLLIALKMEFSVQESLYHPCTIFDFPLTPRSLHRRWLAASVEILSLINLKPITWSSSLDVMFFSCKSAQNLLNIFGRRRLAKKNWGSL